MHSNTEQVYTNNSGALFVCNVRSAGYVSAARKTAMCFFHVDVYSFSYSNPSLSILANSRIYSWQTKLLDYLVQYSDFASKAREGHEITTYLSHSLPSRPLLHPQLSTATGILEPLAIIWLPVN